MEKREGLWVGIEWDDAFRGKHNGSLNNVCYFETAEGEKSGSFVPVTKFHPGCELVKALLGRYSNFGEDAYDEEDMFVSTVSNKSKRIELVGLNKIEKRQKNIQLLKTVDLSGACIARTVTLS